MNRSWAIESNKRRSSMMSKSPASWVDLPFASHHACAILSAFALSAAKLQNNTTQAEHRQQKTGQTLVIIKTQTLLVKTVLQQNMHNVSGVATVGHPSISSATPADIHPSYGDGILRAHLTKCLSRSHCCTPESSSSAAHLEFPRRGPEKARRKQGSAR